MTLALHLEAIFLKKKTNGVMPKSNVNNCSQLVRIFALSSCAFLLSDRTQFCSQTVRNFALGPYAILLVDRTQFCSRTVRNFVLRPLLVLIFALKPLLVPATYRATVVLLYGCSCLSAINEASLMKTTVAVDPNPPVVEKTNGEKEPNSISRMRCSYARFFSSSARR